MSRTAVELRQTGTRMERPARKGVEWCDAAMLRAKERREERYVGRSAWSHQRTDEVGSATRAVAKCYVGTAN